MLANCISACHTGMLSCVMNDICRPIIDLLFHINDLTVPSISACFHDVTFPKLTEFWKRFEVLRHCYGKLPRLLFYNAEDLRDSRYGWLVVAYTEFMARTLAFLLFEAYEKLGFRAVSPDTCHLARELHQELILSSAENAKGDLCILTAVEPTELSKLPDRWSFRIAYGGGSSGCVGPGAYYT